MKSSNCVVGVPDKKWAQYQWRLLSLRMDKHYHDKHCDFGRDMLAHYKVPAHFYKATDFPRTASGKVQRHKLRDLIANASEIE